MARTLQTAADGPMQRKLELNPDKGVKTPSQIVLEDLGIPKATWGRAMGHRGGVDRARDADADITPRTLRSGDASEDTRINENVTKMARAEHFLLVGKDAPAMYQAGHLIGDQLIAGKHVSIVYANMAPLLARLNSPNVSGFEAWLKTKVQKVDSLFRADRGLPALSATQVRAPDDPVVGLRLEARLQYDPPYSLMAAQIRARLGALGDQSVPDDAVITIPRRIPKLWTLTTRRPVTPNRALTPEEIAAKEEAKQGRPRPLPKETVPALGQPTADVPFSFRLTKETVDCELFRELFLKQPKAKVRHALAAQWAPPLETTAADVRAHVRKHFADVPPGTLADVGEVIVSEAALGETQQRTHAVVQALADLVLMPRPAATAPEFENLVKLARAELDDASQQEPTALAKRSVHLAKAESLLAKAKGLITTALEEEKSKAAAVPPAQETGPGGGDVTMSETPPTVTEADEGHLRAALVAEIGETKSIAISQPTPADQAPPPQRRGEKRKTEPDPDDSPAEKKARTDLGPA